MGEKQTMYVVRRCRMCKEKKEVKMTVQQYVDLENGEKLIQDILPNHSIDERELLVSGVCGSCFDSLL